MRSAHLATGALGICGRTPQGRAIVHTVGRNGESAQLTRTELWREGALQKEISDEEISDASS